MYLGNLRCKIYRHIESTTRKGLIRIELGGYHLFPKLFLYIDKKFERTGAPHYSKYFGITWTGNLQKYEIYCPQLVWITVGKIEIQAGYQRAVPFFRKKGE